MKNQISLTLALCLLAVGTPSLAAAPKADAAKEGWDVNAPPRLKTHEIPIKVDEGSWMNVDVSPDGKTIAFDILGDIYTMPIAGGTPKRIAEGLAYEHQPRFSPDGKRIAFTSDRGGGDNIWIMNVDGTGKVQLTKEDFRLMNQPSWSPDGRFIIAKKHFTTERSAGTGEVWLYHVSGGGGVKLVKRANEQLQKELGEPIYAPDGKSFYYTRNVTPGNRFEYAQDSHTELFNIERYELDTGEVTTALSGLGGSVRPTPAPDGKKIAFVRRVSGQSTLWVKDFATGVEKMIYDKLDRDLQETWAITGVYPNMSWLPDSSAIVFWAGGKLRRVNADGTGGAVIPFQINDTRVIVDALETKVDVAPATFETKIPRWASVSPDGSQVVFETLGKLWIKPMAGGAPKRLVAGGDEAEMELWPSWSRDGSSIVFVAWTDLGLGHIRIVPASGGAARTVTAGGAHYASPHFSPDGATIAYEKRSAGGLTSPLGTEDPGIYTIPTAGGEPSLVSRDGFNPQYGATNGRLFMLTAGGGKRTLISADLDGEAQRTHAQGELVSDYVVSPDGQYLVFKQNYEAFVMPLMPGTQSVDVDKGGSALPITKVSAEGADFVGWSNGEVHWSMGPTLFSAKVAELFKDAPQPKDAPKFTPPKNGLSLSMTVPAAKAIGTVALTGAKIVTMADKAGGIIPNGTIVIEGDRITAIGPSGSTAIPTGAKTIDMAGKTIIPGIIDAHAHGSQGENLLVPQQNWSAIANLAYGTTTIHDPSSTAAEIFVAAEMQQAGKILAPRTFSTAEVIYGAKSPDVYAEINSYEDALADVRRLKAQGAHSVKNYNQPRRNQRQMVVAAAQAENMAVVPEGSSLYTMDISLIQDGNSTVEHNVPLEYFYDDVVSLWSQSKTNYTPTLVVTYGGLAGDPYWRAHTDVWKAPILMKHEPPAQLEAQNIRRVIAGDGDYVDDDSAREAKKLADAGVEVSIGAHGQQSGLGSHWELWSFVRGGWTPVEALAAGTIMPARALGYAKDIGSLEKGKLADLVVLDADPTADIRNTEKVYRVMLGGRLYDPMTMDEVETGTAKRAPYWWEGANGNGGFGAQRVSAHMED